MQQKYIFIKHLRHIIIGLAWTLAGVYMLGVVLLHIPAVQHAVASKTSEALQHKLGTKVSLGNISLGLLNRIVVDEVTVEDQQRHKMFSCHRLSAKIDITSIFEGRIVISSAQIFGMKAVLSKANLLSIASSSLTLSHPRTLQARLR